MRKVLFTLLFLANLGWAAEINPYAHGKISREQWQKYFKQVSADTATVKHEVPEEKLVTFSDDKAGKQYVFTLQGNPAHPAALAREIDVRDGKVSVREVGYFAGNEAEFKQLFGAFSEHNRRFVAEANQQEAATPAPAPVQEANSIGFKTVAEAYAALQADPKARFRKNNEALIADVPEGPNAGVWWFSPKGHPAHPAVIKRTPVERSGESLIHMQALCGASKENCELLVKEFEKANQETGQEAGRQPEARSNQ